MTRRQRTLWALSFITAAVILAVGLTRTIPLSTLLLVTAAVAVALALPYVRTETPR